MGTETVLSATWENKDFIEITLESVKQYNYGDPERVGVLGEELIGLGQSITGAEQVIQTDLLTAQLLAGWQKKAQAKLLALSSNDFYLGWGEDLAVERFGARLNGQTDKRRGEILAKIEQIKIDSDNGQIDWGTTDRPEQSRRFNLLLLGGSGAIMEEVNYMRDVDNLPWFIARKMAVIEANRKDKCFNTENAWSKVDSLQQQEAEMLAQGDLEAGFLIAGKRKRVYFPKVEADPAKVGQIEAGLTETERDLRLAQILLMMTGDLVDDVGLIFRVDQSNQAVNSEKPVVPGDKIIAFAVVAGKVFKYEADVAGNEGKLKLAPKTKIINSLVSGNGYQSREKADWRFGLDDLKAIKENSVKAMRVAAWLLTAKSPDLILQPMLKMLFNRLVIINLEKKLGGKQQQTTEAQLGAYLYVDKDGLITNPGHAKGGVQNMIRLPVLGGGLTDLRCVRIANRQSAWFNFEDLKSARAYLAVIESVLLAGKLSLVVK